MILYIHSSYFYFSASILSLITIADILMKFQGPGKLRNFMILLITSNALLAFINFLPEKTVLLQLIQIFANICIATSILHILSFYHFTNTKRWINLIPVLGMIILSISLFYNREKIFERMGTDAGSRVFFQPYKEFSSNTLLIIARTFVILLFLYFYFNLAWQLVKKYKKYNNIFARKLRNWVLVQTVSPFMVISQNIIFTIRPDIMFAAWITIMIYHLNALVFLFRPNFINRPYLKKKTFETIVEKNEQSLLSEEIFFNEFYNKAYFTNPKASLPEFAERLNVPQHELLRFIHVKFGRSFNEILQEERIELFKELASRSEFKHYTIEGLAKEVGFTSRQSFYIAFKKIDGGVPTDVLH